MPGDNTAEDAVELDQRNEPPVGRGASGATGASQGLLDRKEVLGGEFSLKWVGREENRSGGGWGCRP